MASPSIAGTATSGYTTNASTSHTLTYPTGCTSGETLIGFLAHKDTTTGAAWPAGWTEFKERLQASGSGAALSVAWRKSDGTETGNFTVTTTNSARNAWAAFRVSGASDPTVTPPEASTGKSFANALSIDSDSLSPSGGSKDYLWLSCAATSHGRYASTWPTNYSYIQLTAGANAGTATHVGLSVSGRQYTAATDDADLYTTTGTGIEESATFAVAIYPGTSAQQLTPALINQTGVVYAPTLKYAQSPAVGLIDQSGVTYAPSKLNQTVPALALNDQTGVVYAPSSLTRTKNLAIGLVDQSGVLYAPSISQQVIVGFIDQTGVLYQPTVGQSAALGLINQAGILYAPTVNQAVTLNQIDQSGILYAVTPQLSGGAQEVNPGLIDQTGIIYSLASLTKTASVVIALIDQSGVIYAPTSLTKVLNLQVPLIDQSGTIFGPSLTQGTQQPVGLVDQSGTIYALSSLTKGNVDVAVALIDQSGQILIVTAEGTEEPATPWDDSVYIAEWVAASMCKNPLHKHHIKQIYRPYDYVPPPER